MPRLFSFGFPYSAHQKRRTHRVPPLVTQGGSGASACWQIKQLIANSGDRFSLGHARRERQSGLQCCCPAATFRHNTRQSVAISREMQAFFTALSSKYRFRPNPAHLPPREAQKQEAGEQRGMARCHSRSEPAIAFPRRSRTTRGARKPRYATLPLLRFFFARFEHRQERLLRDVDLADRFHV
jgi:hypothetical protein